MEQECREESVNRGNGITKWRKELFFTLGNNINKCSKKNVIKME